MSTVYEEIEKLDLAEIRARLSDALNRTSSQVARESVSEDLQAVVRRLGQLVAGLSIIDPEHLPARGAGYGSTVVVENTRTGNREEYMLMAGPLVDIDANQVSLASPIGSALLGRVAGEEIVIETPQQARLLRIISVTTLMESMGDALYI